MKRVSIILILMMTMSMFLYAEEEDIPRVYNVVHNNSTTDCTSKW